MSSSDERIKGYEDYRLLGIQRWYLTLLKPIAFGLARLYIDPNVITLAGMALAVATAFCLAQGLWLIALILIVATAFCDMIDGPVARAIVSLGKKRQAFSERIGAIIDPIADRVCDISFMAGLIWYAATHFGPIWPTLVFFIGVTYLLSSWLRTFMQSQGYAVIQGKPLTRTVFFVALLILCILATLNDHGVVIPYVFRFGIVLLLSSTTLPLLYRVLGGARAVWRAHNGAHD